MFLLIFASYMLLMFSFFSINIISFNFSQNYDYNVWNTAITSQNIFQSNSENTFSGKNLIFSGKNDQFKCFTPDYDNYQTGLYFNCIFGYMPPNNKLNSGIFKIFSGSDINYNFESNNKNINIGLLNQSNGRYIEDDINNKSYSKSIKKSGNRRVILNNKNNNWVKFSGHINDGGFYNMNLNYKSGYVNINNNLKYFYTTQKKFFSGSGIKYNTGFYIPSYPPQNLSGTFHNSGKITLDRDLTKKQNKYLSGDTIFRVFSGNNTSNLDFIDSGSISNACTDNTFSTCSRSDTGFSTGNYSMIMDTYLCINGNCGNKLESQSYSNYTTGSIN